MAQLQINASIQVKHLDNEVPSAIPNVFFLTTCLFLTVFQRASEPELGAFLKFICVLLFGHVAYGILVP